MWEWTRIKILSVINVSLSHTHSRPYRKIMQTFMQTVCVKCEIYSLNTQIIAVKGHICNTVIFLAEESGLKTQIILPLTQIPTNTSHVHAKATIQIHVLLLTGPAGFSF